MPALRTELTEIVTGLGMLGIDCLDEALDARPQEMLNVTTREFDRLSRARDTGEHDGLFEDAWRNGQAFASSVDGLRHRKPLRVEWKGSHRPPAYEQIPADLRVDYVYLVSCKYKSSILYNVSPAHLFEQLLTTRTRQQIDWFSKAAPDEYQNLYQACRDYLGTVDLPQSVHDLNGQNRQRLKETFQRTWPPDITGPYRQLCTAVSEVSASRWQTALGKRQAVGEEMLWRILRLQSAPYFIIGMASDQQPVRFRVDTPWDFRQRYTFRSFEPEADTSAGQPKVIWQAEIADTLSGEPIQVKGHVEVRWSHGRFSGAPEAKVYLDTPHQETPGYSPLRCSPDGS